MSWQPGRVLYRGTRRPHLADALVPGLGDTRFAPLDGVAHAYVAASRTAALLESALHEASGPDPTLYLVALDAHVVTPVLLAEQVRLVDLRGGELDRLGIRRDQLVHTAPEHYPCTRRWAAHLHGVRRAGEPVAGLVWHSRQADLHAAAHPDGLLADVLVHRPIEVAVLWHPHGPPAPLAVAGPSEPLVVGGRPTRLVAELSALIGAPIE